MSRADPDDFMPLRQFLARHPSVVEATRIAASLLNSRCQVVVFERSWAFVVAASGGEVLQPRRLVESESALFGEAPLVDSVDAQTLAEIDAVAGLETQSDDSSESHAYPIIDRRGDTVAALTIHGPVRDEFHDGMAAIARGVTGLIVSHAFDRLEDDDAEVDPAAIADGLRDAIVVVDEEFDITWANEAVGSLLGRSRSDLVGRNAVDLIHPDDLADALDAVARIVKGLTIYRVRLRLQHGDGGWSRVEVTATDQTANGSIRGIVMSLRSDELELELEQVQQRSRDMSAALVEQLHDGIIATDAVGAITLVNRAAYRLFGIPEGTPPGRLTWRDFPLLDQHGSVVDREHHPARVLFGANFDPSEEMSVISKLGEHRYVSVTQRSVVGDDQTLQGSFVTLHDVTATREAQTELVSQALHDQLTGLPNRRMLTERLVELKARRTSTRQCEREIAACFLDLDIFKLINDTHGHKVGDQMIRIAADRLASQLRDEDLLVRIGGDEFVALLVDVASDQAAHHTADRLRASLSEPFVIDGLRFDITASAGVALATLEELDEDTLLRQADIALYAAKARGRNRTEIFDTELEVATEVEERQRRMLRHALDNDGIVMHFQPLINSETGIAQGFEALARCLDSDGTLYGPGAFLESIAGSGLIWELDRHAFQLSCEAAAVLGSATEGEPPIIACNFSPLSIVQAEFVSFVRETARAAGVDPHLLCIEITESAAFAGGKASLEAVAELHEAGFLIALDDFGTGYSSLSHLRDLPLSSVKVDKSFVAKLAEQSPERAIAEAVVGLATDLGLGIVAEGVETSGQLAAAKDLGFNVMQGWHYAAAMPLDELLHNWVARPAENRHDHGPGAAINQTGWASGAKRPVDS